MLADLNGDTLAWPAHAETCVHTECGGSDREFNDDAQKKKKTIFFKKNEPSRPQLVGTWRQARGTSVTASW